MNLLLTTGQAARIVREATRLDADNIRLTATSNANLIDVEFSDSSGLLAKLVIAGSGKLSNRDPYEPHFKCGECGATWMNSVERDEICPDCGSRRVGSSP